MMILLHHPARNNIQKSKHKCILSIDFGKLHRWYGVSIETLPKEIEIIVAKTVCCTPECDIDEVFHRFYYAIENNRVIDEGGAHFSLSFYKLIVL